MRPRVFPAEDKTRSGRTWSAAWRMASMRPRVFPAEDVVAAILIDPQALASMRPRVFPAEDRVCQPAGGILGWCFNEAAGIPRGRLRPHAEGARGGRRFNEAAGIPRGRHPGAVVPGRRRRRFNEAAGIPRGRRAAVSSVTAAFDTASMRPRVFPAEDSKFVGQSEQQIRASMRPRVFPAEDRACTRPPSIGPWSFNEAAGIPRGRPSEADCPVANQNALQ